MNRIFKLLLVVVALSCSAAYAQNATRPIDLVRPMTGTADPGNVTPIATAPFGMVGLGPDTFYWGSNLQAAAKMGDVDRMKTYLTAYQKVAMRNHNYPLYNSDAAKVCMAAYDIIQMAK